MELSKALAIFVAVNHVITLRYECVCAGMYLLSLLCKIYF